MKVIGLTGGIASGKSSVGRLMQELGAAVIDADQLARDAVLPGQPAHAAIVAAFGTEILNEDGTINREHLGAVVFRDTAARKQLEAIVHPAIKRLAEQRLSALRDDGCAVAVYMAPLLIEAGATDRVDEIWVVYVGREAQLQRLMARDNLSWEDAVRRVNSQMPMEEKKRHGRIVIDNSGPWETTAQQVRKIWSQEFSGDNQ